MYAVAGDAAITRMDEHSSPTREGLGIVRRHGDIRRADRGIGIARGERLACRRAERIRARRADAVAMNTYHKRKIHYCKKKE